MTPAPKMAIACPCFSRGLMSSSTAWESGISAAPNTPCSRRKITSSGRLVAMPQSIEAITNPEIETRNRRLRPTRPATQPVSGVMIAAAMI